MKNEYLSRLWYAVALFAVAILAAVPPQYLPLPPRSVGGFVLNGALAVAIVGFWLRMLIECFARKPLKHRPLWIALFFAVPIFSAFIYFGTTRSLMYENHVE